MKKIFFFCLGIGFLLAGNALFAQTGTFETLNLSDGDIAGTFTVFDGRDVRFDVEDDFLIRFPNGSSTSMNVLFNGSSVFSVARTPGSNALALFRPSGTNNNLGHLEFGNYGNITGSAKWLGLGSGPAGIGASVYGLRTQWNANFGIFNLLEVNSTTRDLVVAWGGTTSNNRLRFNYANSPTGAPTTYMQIESNGNVGIGGQPGTNDQLFVNGRIRFGSVEAFEDTGANLTTSTGSLVPSVAFLTLGNSTNRWSAVFAQNGTIQTSDRRDKTNIENVEYGLDEVMTLRPVSYDWKTNPEQGTQVGFIAQEVNEILPEVVYDPNRAVVMNEAGEYEPVEVTESSRMGINYALLTPVLVKAIQEQQDEIEEQQALIADLQAQLNKVLDDDGSGEFMPKLYQNNPNPFEAATEIGYYLPNSVQRADLFIYDMQGTQVLEVTIEDRGEGAYALDGNLLGAGMYLYALVADGQEVDVKRMIVTKTR